MQKRILVVDDDKMNLRRTSLILEKGEKVDLILMDIAMPGMNGIEAFERIKESGMDIPVIFLTASGHEDNVMTAIRMGAANYLKKPYMPKNLLARVEKEFEKE